MKKYLKQESKKINNQLKVFFPRKITKKWLMDSFEKIDFSFDEKTLNESICNPVWNFLDRGGKRWRPTLMLLCCEAVGGDEKIALPFTVIPELAHSGSIVVDDVEDQSLFRRGKPSLHRIYGLDLAINVGNLMYFLPLKMLFKKSSLSSSQRLALYDVFSQEMLKLSFGQSMDIFWHQGKKTRVKEKDYLQMCVFKTGALARMSAKFGAIIGGGTSKQINALGDFASTIGVAFQIQDDILNISSYKGIGKEFGDDIKEGKRSLPIIYALNNASKKDAKELLNILNLQKADKKSIREAIRIIIQTGSLEYSKKIALKLINDSWCKLETQLPNSAAKRKLKEFAQFLINRNF